jgi:hypothetical protein
VAGLDEMNLIKWAEERSLKHLLNKFKECVAREIDNLRFKFYDLNFKAFQYFNKIFNSL